MRKTFVLLLLLILLTLLLVCVLSLGEPSSDVSSGESASSLSEDSGGRVVELPASVPSAVESVSSPSATGESSVVSNEPPVVSSEPPVVSSEPPAVSSEPPAVISESPAVSSEPPVVSSEPPVVSSEPPAQPPSTKPHIVNGFLVYDYRAMEQFGGTAKSGQLTAELLNQFKAKVGEDVNVYAMPIPIASAFYAPEGYERNVTNAQNCFYGLRDALDGVRFVDVLSALRPHTSEDIYARTDHHWFALGAFYAAEELCKTAGADFAPLTQFERCSFDGFLGSAYSSYGVSELAKCPETFVWFEPKQSCTVNYYTQKFKFSSSGSLFSSAKSYTKFIRGDGNAVQIQTGVQNGRKLLVVKDSFGNALAPFLLAGFEEVYLVDIRDFACNILTFIREHQITDVSFSVSAFTVAGSKRNNITRLMNL